jgi:DNA adenine methylase
VSVQSTAGSSAAAATARAGSNDAAIRPPLKWVGGKRWLVPYLQPLWARYRDRRLVEPLCGGLAIALGLSPARALLNDINPHTINFYRWLQGGPRLTLPVRYDAELYYSYRERFNALIAAGQEASTEAAELFYYLNRTGYNGLCRFNRRGQYNVPFGRYKTINYATDFSPYREIFSRWTFTVGTFSSVVLEPSDVVYADPPYDVEFTQYTKEGFGWGDQVRLAEWLARHSGPVLLSNQATPRVVQLYEELGFTLHYLDAPRRISCTGDRRPAREVLALRNV